MFCSGKANGVESQSLNYNFSHSGEGQLHAGHISPLFAVPPSPPEQLMYLLYSVILSCMRGCSLDKVSLLKNAFLYIYICIFTWRMSAARGTDKRIMQVSGTLVP